MSNTLNKRSRELTAQEFVAREEEKLETLQSGKLWADGYGQVFWSQAIRHARPGQLRTVIAALGAVRSEGVRTRQLASSLNSERTISK